MAVTSLRTYRKTFPLSLSVILPLSVSLSLSLSLDKWLGKWSHDLWCGQGPRPTPGKQACWGPGDYVRTTPGRLRLGPWVSTWPAGISLPKIHKHRNRKTRKILKKFSLVMLRGRFVWFGVCVWLCLLVLRMNQYWGVGARAPRAGRRQQNRRNMTGRTFLRHVCTWIFLWCLWVCAYVGFCCLLWCCAYVDFLILVFVVVCIRRLYNLFVLFLLYVCGLLDLVCSGFVHTWTFKIFQCSSEWDINLAQVPMGFLPSPYLPKVPPKNMKSSPRHVADRSFFKY